MSIPTKEAQEFALRLYNAGADAYIDNYLSPPESLDRISEGLRQELEVIKSVDGIDAAIAALAGNIPTMSAGEVETLRRTNGDEDTLIALFAIATPLIIAEMNERAADVIRFTGI